MRRALLPAFAVGVVSGLASSQNLVLNGDFEISTSSGCLLNPTSRAAQPFAAVYHAVADPRWTG